MKTKLQFKSISRLAAVVIVLASVAMATAQDVNGPRRSNWDGIPWFELPQGGFFCESPFMIDYWYEEDMAPNSTTNPDYYYYVVPAFSTAHFKNLIPEQPYEWVYQDRPDISGDIDDDGGFSFTVDPFDEIIIPYTGIVPDALPSIIDQSITPDPSTPENYFFGWTRGWFGANGSVTPLCLAPSKKCIPVGSGMLSTGYALGTGEGSDGFVQVVTKPADVLYVENISAKVVSKTQPLAGDATLTMAICHVGQDDAVGTPFITLTATADDQSLEGQDGDMKMYNLVFHTADGQPFVINERFALKVTGCSENGVDVGFQVQQKPGEFVCPAVKSLSVDGVATDLYGFSADMVAYLCLNGVFDNVYVCGQVISTGERTETMTVRTFSHSQLILLRTAGWYNLMEYDDNGRPLGEQRYHPVKLPDWISYEVDFGLSQWSDSDGQTPFSFNFAALPDGVSGRYFKVYFTGLGVISNPMTFIQGDVTVPEAGDLNYDAVVDVADVNEAINLILNDGKLIDNPDADVNRDGSLDIADVNALINIILAN